jgi:hypothetical protein
LLKLSRKPNRSVVSEGVKRSVVSGAKRSAEDGKGGGGGKRLDNAGSKVKSKSAKGAGGIGGEDMVVGDEEEEVKATELDTSWQEDGND